MRRVAASGRESRRMAVPVQAAMPLPGARASCRWTPDLRSRPPIRGRSFSILQAL